jgi:hypothetical protein
MTRRFFYTDALAAAWQAKHFEMRFWNGGHEIHVLPLVDGEGTGRWYIHPDSLHLLEPKEGDLVKYGLLSHFGVIGDRCEYDVEDGKLFRLSQTTEWDMGESFGFFASKRDAKIIQRNGIPFHWPQFEESEAA